MKISIDGAGGSQLERSREFQDLVEQGLSEALLLITELGELISGPVGVTLGEPAEPGTEGQPDLTAWIEEIPDRLGIQTGKMMVAVILDRLLEVGQSPCGELLSHELRSVVVRWRGYGPEFYSAVWLNPGDLSLTGIERAIADLEEILPYVRQRLADAQSDRAIQHLWEMMVGRIERRLTDLRHR